MMVIDGKDLILGRLAAFVAKQALLGETVHVVNADLVVITGNKRNTIAAYKRKVARGAPLIGPYFPRMPDRIVRRTVRGMLDYNAPRGKSAFARVKCHIGVPSEFVGKAVEVIGNLSVEKTHAQYITVGEISRELGAKL